MDQQDKTFGLSQPHEYYGKLEWELEQLMGADQTCARELTYHALNIAITAWHMIEWTFAALTTEQRRGHTLASYQTELRKNSRYLSACRDIATAGKHVVISKYPDLNVETVPVMVFTPPQSENGYEAWCIFIDDEPHHLDTFALDVMNFWKNHLNSLGLLSKP